MLVLAGEVAGRRILDAGCGSGPLFAALRDRGANVSVSPQIPDESLTLTEKHSLAFDVLSDLGSDTAKQYGLAFDLPDDLAATYDKLGFGLQCVNNGHPRTLPTAATYVIACDGVIHWAFVDSDYTARAEPADIIAALDNLGETR
ncbi:AhpC/TSA family protein [Streptomyces sp. Ag109_O5-1]|nr:AhpC/TSA family protein [Streptomyces sp. Ag109_O5-1]